MKTMRLKDSLYSALEEEACRSGRTVNELVAEVMESCLWTSIWMRKNVLR